MHRHLGHLLACALPAVAFASTVASRFHAGNSPRTSCRPGRQLPHRAAARQADRPDALPYNFGFSVPTLDFSSINDCIQSRLANSALAAAATSNIPPLASSTGSPRST